MALLLQDGTPLLLQNGEELLLQSDNLAVLGPNDQTVGDEQFATFEVIAVSNDPGSLTYQWYEETAGLLVGETTSVLTFIADYTTDNGLVYYCIVTDSSGTIESAHATLTVTQKQLVFLNEPSDTTVIELDQVTFSAVADGHPAVTYQWYDGVGMLAGETGPSLTFQTSLADDARSFYCEATDGYGIVWTSATGVLTVVEKQGKTYQDIRMKTPSGQWIELFRGLTRWQGQWQQGTYLLGDQVEDNGWLMVANKETTDRAAIIPSGIVESVYDDLLGGTGFTISTTSDDFYVFGNRYKWENGGFVRGWRWYCPEASGNFTYEVVYVVDGVVTTLLTPHTPTSTGWKEEPFSGVWRPGTEVDVLVLVRTVNPATTFFGDWDIVNSNGNPGVGEANFQSNGTEIRISHTDDAAADRQTELEAVTVGASFQFGTGVWTIVSIITGSGFIRYGLAPSQGRLEEGIQRIDIAYGGATTLSFPEEANLALGEPNISGIAASNYDPANPPATNDNYYGIDVLYEEADRSPDWEFQAFTEIASSDESGDFGAETLPTDPDAPVAEAFEYKLTTTTNGFMEMGRQHIESAAGYMYQCRIVGKRTDAYGYAGGIYSSLVSRNGAVAVDLANISDHMSAGTGFRLTADTNDVVFEVDGKAAETWDWTVIVTRVHIDTV